MIEIIPGYLLMSWLLSCQNSAAVPFYTSLSCLLYTISVLQIFEILPWKDLDERLLIAKLEDLMLEGPAKTSR